MDTLGALAFCFAVGLTLAGLIGTLLEMRHACRLTLGSPFVDPARVARSLGVSLAAGAFMLVNDALAARRRGAMGRPAFGVCLAIGAVWILSTGVVATELALVLGGVLHAGP